MNKLTDKMNYLHQLLKLHLKEVLLLLKEAYKIYKKYLDMNIIDNKPFKINRNNVHYVEKMLN